jgi:hypothetical protein
MRVRGLKKVFTFYIIKHYCLYPLREDLTAEGRTRVEDAEVRKGRSFLNCDKDNKDNGGNGGGCVIFKKTKKTTTSLGSGSEKRL